MLWAEFARDKLKGKKIAVVHDKTTYGKGLADAALDNMHKFGIKEVLYEGVNTGEKDYSAIVSKIKESGADYLMWGGLHTEGGLIIRQMRDQGMKTVMISGDGITDNEFSQIGGPGVEGTLMSFGPDPRNNANAKDVVAEFKAKNFDPEAYTLYSYAAVQIMKQAAEKAKSLDPKKIAEAMHSGMTFHTVIGDIAYDKKGDRTSVDYVWYVWKKGPTARSPTSRTSRDPTGCGAHIAVPQPSSAAERRSPPDNGGFLFCRPHPICPNCGKVSISQKETFWKPPVRNATPVATKKDADGLLDPAELLAQMARSAHERADRGRGEDEGQAEPEAVDGEQRRAAGDGVPAAGDGENGGQDRADAGRPAEREGEAHRIGAPDARGFLDLEPLLAQHRADPEHAEKMQAHQDHADSGRDRQRMAPLPEQLSQRRRGGAQADEHGREAGHEQERGDQDVAPRLVSRSRRPALRRSRPQDSKDRARRAAARRAKRKRSGPRRTRPGRRRQPWPHRWSFRGRRVKCREESPPPRRLTLAR